MSKALVTLAIAILLPMYIYAADGQVLINQSTLNSAHGTYSITQPGSYKLTSNLTARDENTDVIVIAADHVSIDLNGFAILGPTDCSGGLVPCARAGLGHGISIPGATPRFNITIRNGTIQGMGGAGIRLVGDSNLIEQMHLRSNGGGGAAILPSDDNGGSIVQYCTVERNGGNDFAVGLFIVVGLVHHNDVILNYAGIAMNRGTISDNLVDRNLNEGLSMGPIVSYKGNVVHGNGRNISGTGVNQGQNICENAACPGAVF